VVYISIWFVAMVIVMMMMMIIYWWKHRYCTAKKSIGVSLNSSRETVLSNVDVP
jgi:hypothetical protein